MRIYPVLPLAAGDLWPGFGLEARVNEYTSTLSLYSYVLLEMIPI